MDWVRRHRWMTRTSQPLRLTLFALHLRQRVFLLPSVGSRRPVWCYIIELQSNDSLNLESDPFPRTIYYLLSINGEARFSRGRVLYMRIIMQETPLLAYYAYRSHGSLSDPATDPRKFERIGGQSKTGDILGPRSFSRRFFSYRFKEE